MPSLLTQSLANGGNRNPFSYEKIEQVARDQATAWLTLTEITNQLNLFQDESQDEYLSGLELATRFAIEDYLGFSIFPTQYRIYYGSTGLLYSAIFLDLPEVSFGRTGVTINSVQYYRDDPNPVITTLSPSAYYYDPTGNRVVVNSLPDTISVTMANPIQVLYTSNANPIGQYPVIKQAGLLLLTHLYNNRSNTTETALKTIPFGVDTLLRPYKTLVM